MVKIENRVEIALRSLPPIDVYRIERALGALKEESFERIQSLCKSAHHDKLCVFKTRSDFYVLFKLSEEDNTIVIEDIVSYATLMKIVIKSDPPSSGGYNMVELRTVNKHTVIQEALF